MLSSDMRGAGLAVTLVLILGRVAAWEDPSNYDEDDDYFWSPTPPRQSEVWPPPTRSTTRRPATYKPPDSEYQPTSNQRAASHPLVDRIYDELIRQYSTPMAALAGLEMRFGVRVAYGASTTTRLSVLVEVACRRLALAGYPSYRPLVVAVAERLAEDITIFEGRTNNPGQRPSATRPTNSGNGYWWRGDTGSSRDSTTQRPSRPVSWRRRDMAELHQLPQPQAALETTASTPL